MELREALAGRRSVRSYTGSAIPRDVMERLLAAAVLAPSAMNTQPWRFVVIQDPARLQAISDRAKPYYLDHIRAAEPQLLARFEARLTNPDYHLFHGSGNLVLVVSNGANRWAVPDCAVAADYLMLAAFEQGLGSCVIGLADAYLNDPATKAELGIPADHAVVQAVTLGYPRETPAPTPRDAAQVLSWL